MGMQKKIMPGTGIEPVQPQGPRDFKSLASTYSATQALVIYIIGKPYKVNTQIEQHVLWNGYLRADGRKTLTAEFGLC